MAQIGHRELAHAVKVVDVATGGEFAVIGLDGLARHEVGRDVGDVVTVVKVLADRVVRVGGPTCIARLHTLRAQMRGGGQGVDLHTRVVVIKLAVDLQTLGGQQVTDRITERGLIAKGREWTFDAIVLATGFDGMTGALMAVDIRGRDGRSLLYERHYRINYAVLISNYFSNTVKRML